MNRVLRATVREDGLVSLPDEALRAVEACPGDDLRVEVEDAGIRIFNLRRDREKAQAMAAALKAEHPALSVDDFMAWRREEGRSE